MAFSRERLTNKVWLQDVVCTHIKPFVRFAQTTIVFIFVWWFVLNYYFKGYRTLINSRFVQDFWTSQALANWTAEQVLQSPDKVCAP